MLRDDKRPLDEGTTTVEVNLLTLQEYPDLFQKTVEVLNDKLDFSKFYLHNQYPKSVELGEAVIVETRLMVDVRESDESAFEFSEQLDELVSAVEFKVFEVPLQYRVITASGHGTIVVEASANIRREVRLIGDVDDPDTANFKYLQCIKVDYILKG